jgi:hypothetical protein
LSQAYTIEGTVNMGCGFAVWWPGFRFQEA